MQDLAHAIARFRLSIVTVFLFTCPIYSFAQEANASGTCTFQDLNLQAFSSSANAINDIGAIVGTFSVGLRTESQAFLLFNGKFTPFTFPGSIGSGASDINNHAQIVGSYLDTAFHDHGFFVQSGGFKSFQVPGSVNTFAMGINNNGDIVGGFFDPAGVEHGFLLHSGKFSIFRFPGSASSEAASINVKSVIVGTYREALVGGRIHGFMVRNGTFATLDFPGAENTFPSRINDLGEVVGSYQLSDFVSHGFVLVNGQFITIDKPDEPPATQTRTSILGVNNRSQIVGAFSDSNIFANLAFQGNCQGVF